MGAGGPKMLQNFLQSTLKTEYAMMIIINQNNLSNPKNLTKSVKNFVKNFTPRRQLPKLLLNFLAKFLTERKYIIKDLSFLRPNYL